MQHTATHGMYVVHCSASVLFAIVVVHWGVIQNEHHRNAPHILPCLAATHRFEGGIKVFVHGDSIKNAVYLFSEVYKSTCGLFMFIHVTFSLVYLHFPPSFCVSNSKIQQIAPVSLRKEKKRKRNQVQKQDITPRVKKQQVRHHQQ